MIRPVGFWGPRQSTADCGQVPGFAMPALFRLLAQAILLFPELGVNSAPKSSAFEHLRISIWRLPAVRVGSA